MRNRMLYSRLWCLFAMFLVITPYGVMSQTDEGKKDVMDFAAKFDSAQKQKQSVSLPEPEAILTKGVSLTAIQAFDSIRIAKQLQVYDFNAAHQQRALMLQYYSGLCIFIMVVAIVIMGLMLSFKQFQLTAEQVRYNLKAIKDERVTIESGNTSIEASQTGMKINTAVIGLAILFLSLAFFFLYLKYVYVIEVVNGGL